MMRLNALKGTLPLAEALCRRIAYAGAIMIVLESGENRALFTT